MNIARKTNITPAGTSVMESSKSHNPDSTSSKLSQILHLEMTRRMSAARIANTLPSDFERVREEEARRQEMLSALRSWSLRVLHHVVHTQADRIAFRAAYSHELKEVA